jgi:MFS family permease
MRLSPLDLQWVMNAELLPLAAVTLVAGALGDRFGQKRIFLARIALYGLAAAAIGFAPNFAPLIVGRFLLEVELMLRGVIRERTRRLGFRLLANELARDESLDLT